MKYRDDGYLPEAIINYLARLGWSHGDDEIFSADQLSKWFDFDHVTSSAAQFNQEKLDWINNHYIKNEASEKLADLIKPKLNDNKIKVIDDKILINAIKLYQNREKNLNVFSDDILFFFREVSPPEELRNKYLDEKSKGLVKIFIDGLEHLRWRDEDVNNFLKEFVKNQQIKFPEIAMPLRTIIAGTDNTPNIGSIIFILGIENVKKRISDYL